MNRRLIFRVLPWFLALALLGWVLRSVSLAETWAVLQRLRWWQIVVLALVNGLVLLTLNGRWWFILRGLGHTVPYLALAGYRLAAFGVSYFTPGPQFGGEPVQVILVEREHGVPRAAAMSAVALDKSLELLANFTFLLAGVLVILQARLYGAGVGAGTAVLAGLLLFLPAAFLVATWAGWRPVSRLWAAAERLPLWRWRPGWLAIFQRAGTAIIASEDEATRFCRERPSALILALLASGVSWLALVGEYWLMLSFLGRPVTLGQTIIILTAARLAFLLPSPGGLGTLEASQMLAFAALGMEPAAGIGASLLIRARDVIFGGMGLLWGGFRLRVAARRHESNAALSGFISQIGPRGGNHGQTG